MNIPIAKRKPKWIEASQEERKEYFSCSTRSLFCGCGAAGRCWQKANDANCLYTRLRRMRGLLRHREEGFHEHLLFLEQKRKCLTLEIVGHASGGFDRLYSWQKTSNLSDLAWHQSPQHLMPMWGTWGFLRNGDVRRELQSAYSQL